MMRAAWSEPANPCVTNGPAYLTNIVALFDTNETWTVAFDIAGGTNEVPYDLFTTTNLLGSNATDTVWDWLDVGYACNRYSFTNQPDAQAFYMLVPPDLDSDGDGLPDAWEWKHFGKLSQVGTSEQGENSDYDGDGVSNLAEFNAGTDPNTIQFYTLFSNLRVSGNTATGAVTVLAGVPAMIAVAVDNTNFTFASWASYNSNFTANLGSTNGGHDVFVGLKGRAVDSQQTWVGYRVTRDTSAPMIVITNPVPGVAFQSLLQLQGYCPEALASVRYDVTNAAGSLTNLEGYVVKQSVDTNTLEITTNWFACVDVPLTNGANTITLRATDRAGNVTASNFTYTFAFPTNPPMIGLWWPQDGAKLSGTSFMVRGWLSDATAAVAAQVAGGGATNVAEGIVERDGKFWLENLPLADGTNTVSLSFVDVGTKTAGTNFTVIKSAVGLTITPMNESVLNDPFVTVDGSFNGSGYKLWVNGVGVTNFSGTNWSVAGVPLPEGGSALIQARAIPTSDNGGSGSGGSGGQGATYENPGNPNSPDPITAEAEQQKEAVVVPIFYDKILVDLMAELDAETYEPNGLTTRTSKDILWAINSPGHSFYDFCEQSPTLQYTLWFEARWEMNGVGIQNGAMEAGTNVCGLRNYQYAVSNSSTPPLPWPGESCAIFKASDSFDDGPLVRKRTRDRLALTLYELRTGGKAKPYRKSLLVVTGGADGVGNPYWGEGDAELAMEYPITNTSVMLGDLGRLGSDGRVYTVLPDNVVRDVTPTVAGNPYYTYGPPTPAKHRLAVQMQDVTLDPDVVVTNAEFIVGQFIDFTPFWDSVPPGIFTNIARQWRLGGNVANAGTNVVTGATDCSTNFFLNPESLENEVLTNCWWISGGFSPAKTYNAQFCEHLIFSNGQEADVEADGLFHVYRPEATIDAGTSSVTVSGNVIMFGVQGVANGINFFHTLTIPTNTSGGVFSGTKEWMQVDYNTPEVFQDINFTNYDKVQNGPAPYGDYPIPYEQFYLGTDIPVDAPATPLPANGFLRFEISDDFKMWMMFKPNGGKSVPLNVVSWQWHGVATNNGSGTWGLASSPSDHSADPQGTPTEDYPLWKSSLKRYHWNPQHNSLADGDP